MGNLPSLLVIEGHGQGVLTRAMRLSTTGNRHYDWTFRDLLCRAKDPANFHTCHASFPLLANSVLRLGLMQEVPKSQDSHGFPPQTQTFFLSSALPIGLPCKLYNACPQLTPAPYLSPEGFLTPTLLTPEPESVHHLEHGQCRDGHCAGQRREGPRPSQGEYDGGCCP